MIQVRAERTEAGWASRLVRQYPLPSVVHVLGWADYLLVVGVAALALVVYTLTLGPGVTGEDSGELISAAHTLGIAHPSGYPLWCLLGKLFTFLPMGSIAWRVNFMSACFGAGAVAIVVALVVKLSRGNRLAAASAGLGLAFSAELWEQSVIAEVYTLNLFLVLLCVLLLALWYEQRQPVHLVGFALVFGLGLCNHHTMALLGPVFLAFVLFLDPAFWKRWKLYTLCTFVSLAALSLYLYLPIRSLANPPIDWGNPETFSDVWAHISRKQYQFALEENAHSLSRYFAQLGAFSKIVAAHFTPWLAVLVPLGLGPLWKRSRPLFGLLLGVGCATTLVLIWIVNFDLDHQSLWLNSVFWIPGYAIAAVLLGMTLDQISRIEIGRLSGQVISGALAAISMFSPLLWHYESVDKSDYFYASDFANNVLLSLEPNALYLPTADHATFPVLHALYVEGRRPDVRVGNKYGYPDPALYEEMPEAHRAELAALSDVEEEIGLEDWIIDHTDRPVYFTKHRVMDGLPGHELKQVGLVFRVVRPGEDFNPDGVWETYEWHDLDPTGTHGELTADYVIGDYFFAKGRRHLAYNEEDEALAAFAQAEICAHGNKEALNNLASACAGAGLLDEAARYYEKALETEGDYSLARRNLAKVYFEKGAYERSIIAFEHVLEEDPLDAEVLYLSAKALTGIGWHDKALTRFSVLAEISPEDPRVFRELGFHFLNVQKDPDQANVFFSRSLELDPNQPALTDLIRSAYDMPEAPPLPQTPGFELPDLGPDIATPVAPQAPIPSLGL